MLPSLASGCWQTRGASETTPRKQRTRWRFRECPWAGRNGGYWRQHRERNCGRSVDRSLCGVPQEAGPSSRDVPLWGWDSKGRHSPFGAIAPARFRCRNKRVGAVNLLRRQMDIVLHPRSGGTFALDRPISIEGSLTKPSIGLFRGSTVRIQETTPLVPSLQAWAATVSC